VIVTKLYFIKVKVGLIVGTHNFAKNMTLGLMMKCALNKNISKIYIFRDSTLVINSMNETSQLQNIILKPLKKNKKY
jgi:hypothetical protein